jgi:hypothetical protein
MVAAGVGGNMNDSEGKHAGVIVAPLSNMASMLTRLKSGSLAASLAVAWQQASPAERATRLAQAWDNHERPGEVSDAAPTDK